MGVRGSGIPTITVAALEAGSGRMLARGPHTRTRPEVTGADAAGRRRTAARAIRSPMSDRITSFSNTVSTS